MPLNKTARVSPSVLGHRDYAVSALSCSNQYTRQSCERGFSGDMQNFTAGIYRISVRLIGVWGRQHLRYIREYHKGLYNSLFLSGKLNGYLADLNGQAEEMFSRLVKELAEKDGITETLKAEDQMLWEQRMNVVRETATEIVDRDLIYT